MIVGALGLLALAALIVGVLIKCSMGKMFENFDPLEGITEAVGKQIEQGLANRYWIDHEVVVKIFHQATLEKYYGATFDGNGDILALTNTNCTVRGFVSSLVEMDGYLNTPTLIRKRLGLDDPSYDKTYGGEVYVMTIDLSDMNLRFNVPVAETSAGLALFQEGGLTSGGARELQIDPPIPVWKRMVEIRRVTPKGYGKPFTPNEGFKHSIINYWHKDSKNGELEIWNPWHDEDDDAWAVVLLRIKSKDNPDDR